MYKGLYFHLEMFLVSCFFRGSCCRLTRVDFVLVVEAVQLDNPHGREVCTAFCKEMLLHLSLGYFMHPELCITTWA